MTDVAWITGGGTGIGRALAEALAQRGWAVVISGRRREPLEETVRAIQSRLPAARVRAVSGSVLDPAHPEAVLAAAAEWGHIALLVNNAGQNPHHSLVETSAEEFRETFDANCLGAILCTKAVLPAMRGAGRGAVVVVSSVLGKWASAGSAAYSVSKYAVAGFTDVLRQELVETPIHVMGVYPGFIRTAMTDPFVEPGSLKARSGKSPEQMARAILRGLDRRASEVHYPWYVPWVIRFHRWIPLAMDRLSRRVRS